MQRACWNLLMISFYTFWLQTDVTFLAFKNGTSSTLLTSTIFRFTFHNHMIQGIKFCTCPCYSRGVVRLCWSVSAILSQAFKLKLRKNFNNGILLPWILWNNLQAVTAVAFIKRKKATNSFWSRFAHDKLTRTAQTNHHLTYLHHNP